jgi:hypothetical protein
MATAEQNIFQAMKMTLLLAVISDPRRDCKMKWAPLRRE